MIKKIFTFFVLFFLFFNFAYSCKFESEIFECNSKLEKFIGKEGANKYFISPGSSLKSIEDFICLQAPREQRLLQISLDKNFKKLDDEMDNFLFDLERAKGTFYGDSGKNYIDGINYIWEKSDYFKEKYLEVCTNEVINDAMECSNSKAYLEGIAGFEDNQDEKLGNVNVLNYIKGNDGNCKKLVYIKVSIFNDVAFNTLLINKQKVLENNKKIYDINQRSNYNNLMDIMMINLGYIERIWQKWPAKIKNAL